MSKPKRAGERVASGSKPRKLNLMDLAILRFEEAGKKGLTADGLVLAANLHRGTGSSIVNKLWERGIIVATKRVSKTRHERDARVYVHKDYQGTDSILDPHPPKRPSRTVMCKADTEIGQALAKAGMKESLELATVRAWTRAVGCGVVR